MRVPPLAVFSVDGLTGLNEICAAFDDFCAANAHWVPAPIALQMGIAVGEVAANIVEHGAKGRPVEVGVRLSVFPGVVEVVFVDRYDPVVADVDSAVMPDTFAERGRGLALAGQVLSELSYDRCEGRNFWKLVSLRFD